MKEPGIDQIVLQNPNRYPEAGARRLRPWLARVVAALVERELPSAGEVGLGVRFTGDRELRRVNREHRGKDSPTDVLSFPGGPSPAGGFAPALDEAPEDAAEEEYYLGDILISVPTARRQAQAHGHSVERELKVLLLHGLLHCLGYDHETDQGEMERLERRLRRAWIGDDHA